MTRICIAACACGLLLAGCMSSSKTTVTQHYTLGGSPAAAASVRPAARAANVTLQVARITVPSWLSGNAMYYRLDYHHDNQLAAYGYSDWVAPPATLLEPLIQHAITASGAWQAVVGPRDPVSATASLHVRIEDFSQVFAQADQSTGNLDATATLVDGQQGRVIAQKHFHIQVAAPSADAQGGAAALGEASRKLAAQLATWLRTVAGNTAAGVQSR